MICTEITSEDVKNCVIFSTSDTQADQSGATALQRGGGDAEGPAAPEHRPLPRLLEVDGEGPQVHHPRD